METPLPPSSSHPRREKDIHHGGICAGNGEDDADHDDGGIGNNPEPTHLRAEDPEMEGRREHES